MPAKSIRPLSSLAEVETLKGSVTMKSHFFGNNKQTGWIDVREIACLNCNGCRQYRYRQCENVRACEGDRSGEKEGWERTRNRDAVESPGATGWFEESKACAGWHVDRV